MTGVTSSSGMAKGRFSGVLGVCGMANGWSSGVVGVCGSGSEGAEGRLSDVRSDDDTEEGAEGIASEAAAESIDGAGASEDERGIDMGREVTLLDAAGWAGAAPGRLNHGCARIWEMVSRFAGSFCRMPLIRSRASETKSERTTNTTNSLTDRPTTTLGLRTRP
jgi:hypothetical protein